MFLSRFLVVFVYKNVFRVHITLSRFGDRPVSLVQSEGSWAYFGLRFWMFLFLTAILFMEGTHGVIYVVIIPIASALSSDYPPCFVRHGKQLFLWLHFHASSSFRADCIRAFFPFRRAHSSNPHIISHKNKINLHVQKKCCTFAEKRNSKYMNATDIPKPRQANEVLKLEIAYVNLYKAYMQGDRNEMVRHYVAAGNIDIPYLASSVLNKTK